ncbi:uracil phosphoribosyltransferase [Bizionia gelidisalsuginis]|uniref:Uracil phosphoribosyltransferase n=2 Tax=Bizionia TaxID=283785 RepID=A0A8H2LCL6_9FLAO|nr:MULTISPECIES: uracil phosphoribosyltransferase [Bizionia]TYB74211.1 uracil phosphoribosyltransferase [Bizionia saleffrena]TYC15673.1 uracil phosphoribosyltransferase [Bizionia gelidisalsuginis]
MKDFFYAIQDFFVNVALVPFDALATIELENWWIANLFSWIFIVIAAVAVVYWMLQLKKHSDNNEEDKSVSSHSFL